MYNTVEERLYGNTVKQIRAKFIISTILGIILAVLMVVLNAKSMTVPVMIGAGAFAVLIFPFSVMSFFLNYKKIFIGLVRPVPILSYFLEWFKGLFWSFKAFFWMIKNGKKKSTEPTNQ